MSKETEGFSPPQSLTPEELGDTLARLVWESFSDFLTEGESGGLLGELGIALQDGFPVGGKAEEILIFFMWAHTRALQLAFLGRAEGELVRKGLDAFHTAIFEDMVANGTPRSQLPLFEQHVSARYAEYHAAAALSDAHLGRAVARRLAKGRKPSEALGPALTERALEVAKPLRDFLEEVELVP